MSNDGKRSRQDRLILAAAWASVCVALILLVAKVVAWFWTGSVGVLASLVDSMLDLLASGVNMLAIRYAMMPPDREHRFGHGKAEALAGLGQATFIASSAIFLLMFSVERIVHPELIESLDLGFGVVGFSIVLTSVLVMFQRYVVKETGSLAIKADSLHYAADFLSNLGVLLGLALYYFGWLYSDPIVALAIALFILKSAFDIGREAVQLLMDRGLPEAEQREVYDVALSHPDVEEVHELRTRQSGRTRFVQMHLVMDGALSLSEAHRISDEVERSVRDLFDEVDILIHQDPHTEKLARPAKAVAPEGQADK